jgi:chemotaxis protein MotB
MPEEKKRPIIIKKKKVQAGGHAHSSAWKIAYADFVTAMMAFFLVMWLINIVVEKKETSSPSFKPIVLTDLAVGRESIDQQESTSFLVVEQKSKKIGGVSSYDKFGAQTNIVPIIAQPNIDEEALREEIHVLSEDLQLETDAYNKIKSFLEKTPEGSLVHIVMHEDVAFFDKGSPKIDESVKPVLTEVAQFLKRKNKKFIIIGYTDSSEMKQDGYSNWNLAFDRANAVREFFINEGVDKNMIMEMRCDADRVLLNPYEPDAAENRRVAIFIPND